MRTIDYRTFTLDDRAEQRLLAMRTMTEIERRKLGCSCNVWLVNGRSHSPRIDIDDNRYCTYCHPHT
jgi:hypothetical protein